MSGWVEADLITEVDNLVQADDNQLRSKFDVIRSYITTALERYNRDYPKHYQWEQAGTGTNRYDFPAQFDVDFSNVVSVESPTGNVPPTFLTQKQFQTYANDYVTYQLLFLEGSPDASVDFSVIFTIRRELADIPDTHKEAFAALVSAGVCDTVAASLANEQDSTISADTVDNTTSSSSWVDKGRAFWRQYASVVLPRKSDSVKAAEVIVDVDSPFAETSTRIFHRR